MHRAALAFLLVAASALPAPGASYAVDPRHSELVVKLFKAGLGSGLAHDHAVRATEFSGTVEFDPTDPSRASITIETSAGKLVVDEPEVRRRHGLETAIKDSDRQKIQATMLGPGQLDAARYPVIRFRSTHVEARADGTATVTGEFTLHGSTQTVTIPVRGALDGNEFRARGEVRLLQSRFGIEPYSAFLGTVRVRDEFLLVVDIVATLHP
ncbi:MAG: YceI family protein [Acidobacteria bacterium]|nr:YceI family protein [Acidobacteriota bacterium]